MGTMIITPEVQKANMEVLLGKDPSKYKNPGERWTANRRRELLRDIKSLGKDQPVTIINMNPFALKINGGMYFPNAIPGCPLGKPYHVHVISNIIWGHKDLGCDAQNMMQMEPVPATPMVQAAEYILQFMQLGDESFGGVICYAGDAHPSTLKKDAVVSVPEINYDEDGQMYVVLRERKFHDMLDRARTVRNASIMREIQRANGWYENDDLRNLVSDKERDLARIALAEGLIPQLPRWVLQENTAFEKTPDPCPSCAVVPKAGAIICVNCQHCFDVIAAYKNARIAYGSVEFDRLTEAEWKEVNKIKLERDRAKEAARAK